LAESKKDKRKEDFVRDLNNWAQELLNTAWTVCGDPKGGEMHIYLRILTNQTPFRGMSHTG